jgi:hypothetical protein
MITEMCQGYHISDGQDFVQALPKAGTSRYFLQTCAEYSKAMARLSRIPSLGFHVFRDV